LTIHLLSTEFTMVEEKVYVDPETGKKIPMKDGKPCRVCVDFKTWTKIGKGKGKETDKTASVTTTPKTETPEIKSAQIPNDEWKRNNCPADVETLGRHTWTLLHTMAAYYPEKPEPKQKESMKSFFQSFSENYPCWFCKVRLSVIKRSYAWYD
jgi:FAD-linked sulfhydryl oxidase